MVLESKNRKKWYFICAMGSFYTEISFRAELNLKQIMLTELFPFPAPALPLPNPLSPKQVSGTSPKRVYLSVPCVPHLGKCTASCRLNPIVSWIVT